MKLKGITDVFFDLDHTLWDFDKNSALTFKKIFDLNNVDINADDFLIHYVPINLKYWRLYREDKIEKSALRFAPLVFVRPGELRHAEWDEINFEKLDWKIQAEKMKMRRPHIVPLSSQSLDVLKEIKPLTGQGRYVFPSLRSSIRPMSNNTVLAALRRMGYAKDEMSGHGFRAMASTILHEQGWPSDVIERQLAHAESNSIKAAYNHAQHLPERRRMMQEWADYLDELKELK